MGLLLDQNYFYLSCKLLHFWQSAISGANEEEEDDPLDAFMAGIENEVSLNINPN